MSALTDRDTGDETAVDWDVLEWRFDFLHRAGYSVLVALSFAENPAVDIHDAAELLAEGCQPEVALRILS